MNRIWHLVALLALLGLAPSASAQTGLRIPLGTFFDLQIHNTYEEVSGRPVGRSKFLLGIQVEGRRGPGDVLQVRFLQRGRQIASANCQPRSNLATTRCESDTVNTDAIVTDVPVEIRFVHVDATTDAEAEVLRLSLPVYGAFDWVGTSGSQRQHVERRQLRLDAALALVVLEDTVDGPVYTREDAADMAIAYWDATEEPYASGEPWSLRCRVRSSGGGEYGEWTGYRIGTPSPSRYPGVQIENRVYDARARDAVVQRLQFQRYAFNVRMPFSVHGARALDRPTDADGSWQCELRAGGAGARRVVRRFEFEVRGNVAQPHAAQSTLYLGAKRIAAAAAFDPESLPASFDPALVGGPVYGMVVPAGVAPLVAGALPTRAVAPEFSRPAGARRGRGRR